MNRSIYLFIFILSYLFLLPPDAEAQNIDVALPDTLILGSTNVLIPMEIDDLTGLNVISFEFTISYDSTIIQIDEVISTDFLADGFLVILNSTVPGRLSVAAAGTAPLQGSGTLISLNTTFLGEGSSTLVFEEFRLGASNVDVQTQNGRVRNVSLASNEDETPLADAAELKGNFPNPFRQGTNIVVDLMEPSEVGIQVFDVLGRLVHNMDQRQMQVGEQHIYFDLSAHSAGVYFYTVHITSQSGQRTLSNTMTFIR